MSAMSISFRWLLVASFLLGVLLGIWAPPGPAQERGKPGTIRLPFQITKAMREANVPVVVSFQAESGPISVELRQLPEKILFKKDLKEPKGTVFESSAGKMEVGDYVAIFSAELMGKSLVDTFSWVRVDSFAEDRKPAILSLKVDPKAGNQFKIDYKLGRDCTVRLEAVDEGEKAKALIESGDRDSGMHDKTWAANVKAGGYFIRLHAVAADTRGPSTMKVPIEVSR